jgi:hypothetical protein
MLQTHAVRRQILKRPNRLDPLVIETLQGLVNYNSFLTDVVLPSSLEARHHGSDPNMFSFVVNRRNSYTTIHHRKSRVSGLFFLVITYNFWVYHIALDDTLLRKSSLLTNHSFYHGSMTTQETCW